MAVLWVSVGIRCYHGEVQSRVNSTYERYYKTRCYYACDAYVCKITNSGVLTLWRGLTAI